MGLYEAFRDKPSATRYGEIHPTAKFDVLHATLIYIFCAFGFSFLILLPGYMLKERISVAIRIFVSLFIGAAILFSNYGMQWEKSSVDTTTQYKAFMSQEISASVGVNIGLRGINVTLKGLPLHQTFDNNKTVEHVDYNEKFRWNSPWSQGRSGFGPHASQLNNDYHTALERGVPYPILLIAEYFTLDGESVRWGRGFRMAGFYTHALLWMGFTLWVVTNILFLNVIRYGAYFLSLTGVIVLLANLIYDSLHLGPELLIPFPDGSLNFTYGWCFWLSFSIGFLCLVLGVLIVALDYFFPGPVATFFNIDIVTEFEDIVEVEEDISPGDELPDASSDTSCRDGKHGEGEDSKKRIHFVSRSRYAGISASWRRKKKPLNQVKSLPFLRPMPVHNSGVRRASSVKINIEQLHDNEAYDDSGEDISGGPQGSKESDIPGENSANEDLSKEHLVRSESQNDKGETTLF
ncbi:dual oxidase maturation factor 1-like [Dendronephthya gigantea]|uniref:dual oxidase maturation factor 1-like n=1 Tax=Dendronephthya gigantea TaxID=151771 RepID=UPI001069043E|nr:dual oxidase maturation factor 1-like [Dendronephthya gigantea]